MHISFQACIAALTRKKAVLALSLTHSLSVTFSQPAMILEIIQH